MANWDQLLPDLLALIVKKVNIYEDFVAFAGVCRSWRSVAIKDNFNQQLVSSSSSSSCSVQPPWLMLASETHEREFVNLLKGGMSRKIELPEAKGKLCIGSMGWLITIDKQGGMELLHPLTRAVICLPHLRTFTFYEEQIEDLRMDPMEYLSRASLSASPCVTDDYLVVLTLGGPRMLAFWKPGNASWTHIPTYTRNHNGGRVIGSVFGPGARAIRYVTYHKDKFYAIDDRDDILLCDDVGGKLQIVGELPPDPLSYGPFYLTEYCGDLLAVRRNIIVTNDDPEEYTYETTSFRIFKRTADADSCRYSKWEEVTDLGGTSIFVGHGTPICVPSAAAVGLKPNCIYFTDDNMLGYYDNKMGGKDMGVYNLATRAIEPLYHGGTSAASTYSPPIWISPSV